MLYEFLETNEKTILGRAISKTLGLAEDKPSTKELEKGLPQFYQDLITALKKGPKEKGSAPVSESEKIKISPAASHGKESQRLGYTVSQVVHGYGTLCQSVTEYAQEKKFNIEAWEFRELNLLLDIAIAQAVTQYTKLTKQESEKKELLRLGELAHELRNTLASATLAQEMIMKGTVGTSGNTSRILVNAHSRMRELIDKSLSEVRLQISPEPNLTKINLLELISDIEATAVTESALANLVQNALKYTKPNTSICIRTKDDGGKIVIEVEDQCGGLPRGKPKNFLKPIPRKIMIKVVWD